MKSLPHLAVVAALSGLAAFAGASAQTAEPELDLGAIRARAAASSSDADALAATARARAALLAETAKSAAATAEAHGRRYAGAASAKANPGPPSPLDFDRMVADTASLKRESLGAAPRFIAFASLSMPPEALRAMIKDVAKAGGIVALRGLPGNSAAALTSALAKVVAPGEALDAAGIDPRLFRAFAVEAVPTYVVASSDFDLCDGFTCRTEVPPHDRMAGNVSAAYALETFARGGGPGALLAAQHLARLERPAS